MTDKIRKEFEVWAESRGLDLYCSRKDIYEETETLWAWSAWKASRKAIVVKLPETPNRGIGYGLFDAGKERCAEAIRAVGLGVEE